MHGDRNSFIIGGECIYYNEHLVTGINYSSVPHNDPSKLQSGKIANLRKMFGSFLTATTFFPFLIHSFILSKIHIALLQGNNLEALPTPVQTKK